MRHSIGGLLALIATVPSAPALASCSIAKFAELPVTMAGLRPTITAAVNGSEQTFLIDSGAFFSVISPGTARDLNLKLEAAPYNIGMRAVGGDVVIQVARVKAFSIFAITIPDVEFIVGGSEPGTAGVVGQNLLGLHDVEYDLPHGAVRLMLTKGCQGANLAYWTKPGEAASVIDIADRASSGFHTIGPVTIDGSSLRAIFDTGAEKTIVSLGAAARIGLTPNMPGAELGGISHGFGRKGVETWIVPVKLIEIGSEEIRNARIRIGNLGTDIDMLIGADFFIAHRVFVSNTLHKLFLSYTGGPMFDRTAHWSGAGNVAQPGIDAAASAPPLDAAALSRRGAVEGAQHDYARAIADLSQAVTLAPADVRYRKQRAMLYLANDQPAPAAADMDEAIRLKADDVEARVLRAQLRLEREQTAEAIEDLDAAASAAGTASDQRLVVSVLYGQSGALDKAIAQSSQWIANHPADAKMPSALNARCWVRALAGKELAAALKDCNAAIRLVPHTAAFFDSRGMVYLRMGDHRKAIADYDAALALDPKIAWSLYGRGIARRASGLSEAAKADMAAALALDPKLPALASQYGIADQAAEGAPDNADGLR